jgi:hypothetical protein
MGIKAASGRAAAMARVQLMELDKGDSVKVPSGFALFDHGGHASDGLLALRYTLQDHLCTILKYLGCACVPAY